MTEGFYHHKPGTLSRWGVVDVGLKCVHSCQFCYYVGLPGSTDENPFAGMRRASFLPRDHVLALVDSLADNGFVGFDVTGGEPTIHPNIVDIVQRARTRGLACRIITLGQLLLSHIRGWPRLLDTLVDGGLTDLLLSVHAVDEARAADLTGGSWQKTEAVMTALDDAGFDYCTNTTVFEQNFRQLPEIAREIARHRVYASNLIVMNAYYAWSRPGGGAAAVQGHYGEVRPYVIEARDILEVARDIAVNIRYAPLCTMRGAERNLVGIVGVRHDPHEWMERDQPYRTRRSGRDGRATGVARHRPGRAASCPWPRRCRGLPERQGVPGAVRVVRGNLGLRRHRPTVSRRARRREA